MSSNSRGPYEIRGGARQMFEYQGTEAILSGAAGTGKAQPLDAQVMTPRGPVAVGSLRVGDEICHPSGGVQRVLQIHPQGVQPVYQVDLGDNVVVECTRDHLWEVYRASSGPMVVTLKEMRGWYRGWAYIRRIVPGGITQYRCVRSIRFAGEKECQCITVSEPDGLYLTNHHVVTHNSLACLARLHFLCESVPNLRCLIARKTRESLTESGLVTFEERVVPVGHPILRNGGSRRMRQAYHYPNGSQIVVGGMDKPSKIMSTEYDLIFIQEGLEISETDWESLITRLRNGRLPYQQIFGDTNPDAPSHWIKQRANQGKLRLFESRHEDNPSLYDPATGWTHAGQEYLARLDQLSGPRKQRLRWGRWVQAEGVVYEEWDRSVHLVDPFPIPVEWKRYLSVDFGYTNPFCCLFAAMDPDGRLYVYREIYRTRTLVEDHAARIREIQQEEVDFAAKWAGLPRKNVEDLLHARAVYCDHDAEDRATLERHLKLTTTPAKKDVRPGIQAVQARLRKAGDGRPRLFVFRDCLDSRDRHLMESKHPLSLVDEFDSYIWEPDEKDKPVKEYDHGMDALKMLVYSLDAGRGANWEAPSVPPPQDRETIWDREEPRLRAGETGGRSRLFGR